MADAVGAAHAADIVHRDLKPDNVFLCASTRHARVVPKVLDFGIAKLAVQGVAGQTKTGMLMGTPAYMSPEQCRGGSKAVDGRSDVYSLGCIFYEVLCGQPPFVRDGAGELIVAHVAEPPDDPRKLVPELPPAIAGLVLRMLGKNVQDRPSDMATVAAELAACVAGLGISRAMGDIYPRKAVEVPQNPGQRGTPGHAHPGRCRSLARPWRPLARPTRTEPGPHAGAGGDAPARQPADADGGGERRPGRPRSHHARGGQRPAGDDVAGPASRPLRRALGDSGHAGGGRGAGAGGRGVAIARRVSRRRAERRACARGGRPGASAALAAARRCANPLATAAHRRRD